MLFNIRRLVISGVIAAATIAPGVLVSVAEAGYRGPG